jgi:hypothetical protein
MRSLQDKVAAIAMEINADKERPSAPVLNLDNLPADCPACVDYILRAMPPKSEHVNFNKLVLHLVTYFKAKGYTPQGALGIAEGFLHDYPHSETYDTPAKRIDHFESQWRYLAKNNGYSFGCSFIKGLHLPGTAFDCKKCSVNSHPGKEYPYSKEGVEKKAITKPFTPDQTRLRGILLQKPAEAQHLVKFKDGPFLTRRIVASMSAAGGTGKTQFLLQASSAWAAGKEFAGFVPVRPLNSLGLYAEEEQADLDRRLWTICQGDFPPGLHARSIKGVVGPLLRIENGSPTRTSWFEWLQQTIKNHHPLDLVLLDPKSRLYGLDENSNDQNTRWVACMETLTAELDVTILFSHHVSKGTKEINQWMARGGGALVDGCRANFGMISLTEDDGKKYRLDDWHTFIKLKISKINIGPKNAAELFLKFDANGVLHPVDVYLKRTAKMKTYFLNLLLQEHKGLTRRELTKAVAGKNLCGQMKAKFPDFTRGRDVDLILDDLLKDGCIYEGHETTSTRGKTVFRTR